MGRLVWDATGEKLYHTGTKNAILFTMKSSSAAVDIKTRYSIGVNWNGITAVTESPSGAEANDNYADDIKYVTIRGAEKYAFTIEAFMAPDAWAECDGMTTIGSIATFGQQNRKVFGFVYLSTIGNDTDQVDYGFEIHINYNATASPSERSYQTIGENPELMTYSWECESDPVEVSDLAKPVSNIIISCTVGNGVLKYDEKSGQIVFNEETQQGFNAKLIYDILRGTDSAEGSKETFSTLPDPSVIRDILMLKEKTKKVEDYAVTAVAPVSVRENVKPV